MRFNFFLSVIVIALIFSSCKKDDATPTNDGYQMIANVAYGTDPLQTMDVYLPANRRFIAPKVMVLIHGGGWYYGDKTDFNLFVTYMKKSFPDYAIFNINYRLSNGTTNIFPTQENDVKSAMQFIYSNSITYRISKKYVLVGASAGGHLAMLQGYKYTLPIKPRAIVSFFGPSDLVDLYNNPVGGNTALSDIFATSIGATPTSNPAIYASSSPINFITKTSPPTILFHGSADPLVAPSQSENVKNKLVAKGVNSEYILYEGKGHGDDWGDDGYADAVNKMGVFLAKNVQ